MQDILKGVKVNSKGFGTIPKLIMQDKKMNVTAKAIYAYLSSFSGGGDSCFPGKDRMSIDLNLSKDTITKYLKQLEDMGYISIEQKRVGGKFSHNIYTILGEVLPSGEKADTVITVPELAVPDSVVSDQLAPNINNNNINKYNNIINPINQSDKIGEIEKYTELIKENIEYEAFIDSKTEKDVVDEIISIIVEVILFNKESIRINGCDIPPEVIKNRFLKLTYDEISYVLFSLERNTTKIRNIKKYLITTLYNAKSTKSNYFNAEVRHDMYG